MQYSGRIVHGMASELNNVSKGQSCPERYVGKPCWRLEESIVCSRCWGPADKDPSNMVNDVVT